MDSEMYSDFAGDKKESHPFELEVYDPKESWIQKDVMHLLGTLHDKVDELGDKIGKQVESILLAHIPVKAVESVEDEETIASQIDEAVKNGGNLDDILVHEVDQLLSDVQSLKKDMTESETKNTVAIQKVEHEMVQVETKLSINALETEVAAMKQDLELLSSNLANLCKFVQCRDMNMPAQMKGSWKDGRLVIRVGKPKSTGHTGA